MNEKIYPLLKGIASKLLINRKFDRSTSGTNAARYCYSVWLRHLIHAHAFGFHIHHKTVAELGPGDSLGTGLAALICGASKYYAMDVHQYWDIQRNLEIFDELVILFRKRTRIPSDDEYPKVHPKLNDYSFPFSVLPDEYMEKMLDPARITAIRSDLENLSETSHGYVRYFIPWNLKEKVEPGTVDFFMSQAVLEYVDDLDRAYRKFHLWLGSGGLMSHCIDFSAHGITRTWNAHWKFSASEWRLVHGNKPIILNRMPRSGHLDWMEKYGFSVLHIDDMARTSPYGPDSFHPNFRNLSATDAGTYASFIVARKP